MRDLGGGESGRTTGFTWRYAIVEAEVATRCCATAVDQAPSSKADLGGGVISVKPDRLSMSDTILSPLETMLPLPLLTKPSAHLTTWLPSSRTTPAPWSTAIVQLLTCERIRLTDPERAPCLDRGVDVRERRVPHDRIGFRTVGRVRYQSALVMLRGLRSVHIHVHPGVRDRRRCSAT